MTDYSPIVSAIVTLVSIALILFSGLKNKVKDIPNERSLHALPVSRLGGVGIMAGVVSGWALVTNLLAWWIVLPLLGMFTISLLDDIYNLSVKKRLSAHFLSAAVLVAGSGLWSQQGVLVVVAMVLLTVWLSNLYNFMDGSDGLAGGMALFGFGAYAIAAWLTHNHALAALNFAVAAAVAAFLFYNFPPAKIFMGDAGSIPLGFLVVAMGLLGWQQGSWKPWFPLLVFLPFIADASVTLVKRSLRGLKVTEAHRDHYYQRLIRLGCSHRNVALAAYALMLGAGASALWAQQQGLTWQTPAAWCALYAILMWRVDVSWKSAVRRGNV